MSKKGGATLVKDAPWRVSSGRPTPRINHSPVLRISQGPQTDYAIAVMKNPNPVGRGLATEAILESAGPECIVPGQVTPVRLLGVKYRIYVHARKPTVSSFSFSSDLWFTLLSSFVVWPVEVDLKFLEPVGKELKLLGKFLDNAVDLMNKSFIDR